MKNHMTDPNDKYAEYKVDLHCNEHHEEDEWNPETDGKISDWLSQRIGLPETDAEVSV